MKNNKILIVIMLLVLCVLFVGCKKEHDAKSEWKYDQKYHWHECTQCDEHIYDKQEHHFIECNDQKKCQECLYETAFTEEENFEYWKTGRDATINHKGEYTIEQKRYLYDELSLYGMEYVCESFDTNLKYYCLEETYSKVENDLVKQNKTLQVVKQIKENNEKKYKYYVENDEKEEITKQGYFVRSDYAKRIAFYGPGEWFEGIDLGTSTTYQEFVKEMKQSVRENGFTDCTVSVKRNNDESVTVTINSKGDYVDADVNKEGYISTYSDNILEIKVLNGYIIYSSLVIEEQYKFDNEQDNYYDKYSSEIFISYAFNNKFYDSINIDTDETVNMWKTEINFLINGYEVRRYNDSYVNEEYTLNDVITFFNEQFSFIIGDLEDVSDYFLVYTDKEMTKLFDKTTLTEDTLTLYIKLNPKNNKSFILYVFEDSEITYLNMIYVEETNKLIDLKKRYSDYKVISIDGKEVLNDDDYKITCEDNKVYVVIYTNLNE